MNKTLFVGTESMTIDLKTLFTMPTTPAVCQGVNILVSKQPSVLEAPDIAGLSLSGLTLTLNPVEALQQDFYV
jgi:hypothetical protein